MSLLTHWEGEPVSVWARLWSVPTLEIHRRVGSTSDRARALGAEGAPGWTTVLAEEQTRGRGRSGERWHSPPGAGLWLSTLVPVPPSPAPCLPLLAGLAAARALESAGASGVGIKWPNDLMLGGRKVGGILCEGLGGAVVVGVGINVLTPEGGFPGALQAVATSAEAEAGRRVSRGTLATRLLAELRGRMESRGRGVGELAPEELEELRRRDVLEGRTVETGAGQGVARGIDARGALLVERLDGSTARVVAGSVRAT